MRVGNVYPLHPRHVKNIILIRLYYYSFYRSNNEIAAPCPAW